MILINIILSGITSMHRHYYILSLNYCKNNFTMLFFQGGGGGISHLTKYEEGKTSYVVESPKKVPHIAKRPPLGEKGSPKD